MTNDTFALRNAAAYIAAREGGTMYFPEGLYPINDSIDLPSCVIVQGVLGSFSLFSPSTSYYFDPNWLLKFI